MLVRRAKHFGGVGDPALHRAREGGFTLLELLIATAVGAVVLLVIQTTYFGALKLHNTTHARIDRDLEQQRAFAIIRRDLGGLMLPSPTSANQTTPVLAGQFQTENLSSSTLADYGDRVTPDIFTSSGRIDAYTQFSEVQKVAYYLQTPSTNDASTGKNLVRVVTRNLLPVQETVADEQQVLLQGVAEASALFFDGTSWTDTWDSATSSTLPRAIRFSVTMLPPPGNAAPGPMELVVPIMSITTQSQREDEEAAGANP